MKYTSRFILFMFLIGMVITARLFSVQAAVAELGAFIIGFASARALPPPNFVALNPTPSQREEFMREWEAQWNEQARKRNRLILGEWTPEPEGGWKTQPLGDDGVSSLFPPPPRVRRFNTNTGTFEP